MYKGAQKWFEITTELKSYGFTLVDWQYDSKEDWGNALYRRARPRAFDPIRRILRRRLHEKIKKFRENYC
jgi:hypothetical protein